MSRLMNRQKNGLLQQRVFRSCVLIMAIAIPSTTSAALNVYFHGSVLSTPCKISAGDENLTVDFGTIANKYLYINTRTPGNTFSLHLDDCNTTTLSKVKITFKGVENTKLPGLLAIDKGNGANGIGVGIETTGTSEVPTSAVPLRINIQGPENLLSTTSTTTVLNFKAYVQVEPDAQVHKAILPGAFSANATFVLDYN